MLGCRVTGNSTANMPSFGIAAKALRKTTERLAREVVQPLPDAPDWDDFEWAIARAAVAMQGTSVLLANSLSWSGPSQWRDFLDQQCEQSLLRDSRAEGLLSRIHDLTFEAGLGCIGLKGSALRKVGLYTPGVRPMGDIDLLIAESEQGSMGLILDQLGYNRCYASRRHIVYEPKEKCELSNFGEHIQNPLTIEVHTKVAESLPVSKIDITQLLLPSELPPGLNRYPDGVTLMLHLLLHAAGNMRVHALRQIQLHDIALYSKHMRDADWTRLIESNPKGFRWWLFPPLELAARYYPDAIPAQVLESTERVCPRALRFATRRNQLTDLSWSNIRIPAFPGLAWSRTPLEALRLVRSRVFPDRTTLAELKHARQIQPHLDSVSWYGISHFKRIIRWLFSRPPRVQTILSVRAALQKSENLAN